MRREGLPGYQRRKGHYGGKSPQAAPNTLARQFKVPAPNISWVTDITYIRHSRRVAVPGGGARPVLSPDRRLGDEVTHDGRLGGGCVIDGRLAAQAQAAGTGAFGSGQPVYRW